MGTDDGKGMVQVGPPAGLPCSEEVSGAASVSEDGSACQWGADISLINAHLATAPRLGLTILHWMESREERSSHKEIPEGAKC